MPRDVRVIYVGNAKALAAAAAVDSAGMEVAGDAISVAGTAADAAQFDLDPLTVAMYGLIAAVLVLTSPITVLATTFAGLATGVVALAAVTGNLGDISGQAAASAEELAEQQQKVNDAAAQAAINQTNYNAAVKQYGAGSLQAQQALITLHSSQQAVSTEQEKLNALQAQGQGPIAQLIAHVKDMANALGEQAAPMARILIDLLDRTIPTVQTLGSQLIDWFGARLPAMLPIFTQIVQGTAGAVLWLGQAWGNLVDFFMAHWAEYTASLKSVFDQIATGIHFVTPLLGLMGSMFEHLGPVIGFIRAHADSLKPILIAVGVQWAILAAAYMAMAAADLLLAAAIIAVASALSAFVHWLTGAGAVFDRLGDWAHGLVDGLRHIPGLQHGGEIRPGPAGDMLLAMLPAGAVIPPNRRMAAAADGRVVNINVDATHPLATPEDVGRAVVEAIDKHRRAA